jgi:hypothetical protein
MARLFSNSEYVDIVKCIVKCAGVFLELRKFPCDFFLWGYMKNFVDSIPIDTTFRNN